MLMVRRQIHRLACRLFVDVADSHLGTPAGKADRDGSSDASGGSRDENHSAAETSKSPLAEAIGASNRLLRVI